MSDMRNMMVARGPKMMSGAEETRLVKMAETLKNSMVPNHPGFRVQGPINPTALPMTATKMLVG